MPIQGQGVRVASDDVPALPGEIAFLARHGVSSELLQRAAFLAEATGACADQVLIRGDWLAEDVFYRALAAELGLPFLDHGLKLGPATRYPHNCLFGVAPLAATSGGPVLAMAPYCEALAWVLAQPRPLAPGLAITTPSRLSAAVLRARAGEVIRRAAKELAEAEPRRSCLDGCTPVQRTMAAFVVGLVCGGAVLAPAMTLAAVTCLSAILFLAMVVIRIAACRETAPVEADAGLARPHDRDLPVYTIIVPLYRERRVFERLIQALGNLDYPALM